MKRFAKMFVIMVGLAILGLVVTIIAHKDAIAQSPTPVSVVNEPAVIVRNSTLPVTVRGITVSAPLPVQGTVSANINGTPAVTLSGTPSVNFSNASTTPLFVRDVDNPARNPVSGSCDLINVSGSGFHSCNVSFFTPTGSFTSVPAGNRLVIEFVGGELDLPTGTIPLEYEIRTTLGATNSDVIFDPRLVGAATPNVDLYKVSQQTRIYEDSGTTVVLDVATNAPPSSQFTVFLNVSGYLVSQ